MIGVTAFPHEPGKLKEAMDKDRLNWRSFDGTKDINRQWNCPQSPSYYILDRDGVIRYKWFGKVGGAVIDAAVEKLIDETEEPKTRD